MKITMPGVQPHAVVRTVLLACVLAFSATGRAEGDAEAPAAGATIGGAAALKYDVLELPAVPSALASKSLIFSISKHGDRYFATGHHGHILYSDDGGDSWNQAQVPVRSAILDIDFPTPELGWAVGHEGVILHSTDGGKTWVKQYDGNRYGKEGLAYYQQLAQANPDNELYRTLIEEMEFAVSQGADKPFFRVAFQSPTHGYALGAYGMVMETKDGGNTWVPVLEKIQNDAFYHIFDFAPLAEEGKVMASGEAGLLLEIDLNQEVGKKLENVPWEGSFFTIVDAADGSLVIGGLRGNMFRTQDNGATWTPVKKGLSSAIVDSIRLADGSLIAAGIGGEVLVSKDNGASFAPLPVTTGGQIYTTSGRIYAVVEGPPGTILVGGPSGIHKVKLPQK